MKSILLRSLATILLFILPFLLGTPLGRHTPYVDTNPFWIYVLIWAVASIAVCTGMWFWIRKIQSGLVNPYHMGFTLFLLLVPILGIVGLAAPPDLSMTMLEHPEREHFRYVLLFTALIPFFVFFRLIHRPNVLEIPKTSRSILVGLFIIAFVAFLSEFIHHYLYPEGLRSWIDEGKAFEDFSKHYDTKAFIIQGAIGRLAQFSLIIWLVIRLYRLKKVRLWSPLVLVFFSLIGIISAIMMGITEMHPPKGFEIMFLFFIPGFPFLLLYWLGVAWLTKFNAANKSL